MFLSKLKGLIIVGLNRQSNLNRLYRVCYTFGVKNLYLINSKVDISNMGNVFSAKDNVNIIHLKSIDDIQSEKMIALEVNAETDLKKVEKDIEYIILGGENVTLKSDICKKRYRIDGFNPLCLTVDEAACIALHAVLCGKS